MSRLQDIDNPKPEIEVAVFQTDENSRGYQCMMSTPQTLLSVPQGQAMES